MTTKTESRSLNIESAEQLQARAFQTLEIDVYRAGKLEQGVKLTRAQAAREILKIREGVKRREAEADKDKAAELSANLEQYAKRDVAEALREFCAIRDTLETMAAGDDFPRMEPRDVAGLMLSHLEKHAAKLEQALFQLGAYEGHEKVSKREPASGWFNERLTRIE